MIDLPYFEEHQAEAKDVLDSVGALVSTLAGQPSVVRLVSTLDPVTRERVMRLKEEVFGNGGEVFDQRTLDEVAADPDALFLVLEIRGRIEGVGFGYYELPGDETVESTDFFLDSGLVSPQWQDKGIGAIALAATLLLVKLLKDVPRVGIAVWGAGRVDDLVGFYSKAGFVEAKARKSPYRCMSVELTDDRIREWKSALGLHTLSAS